MVQCIKASSCACLLSSETSQYILTDGSRINFDMAAIVDPILVAIVDPIILLDFHLSQLVHSWDLNTWVGQRIRVATLEGKKQTLSLSSRKVKLSLDLVSQYHYVFLILNMIADSISTVDFLAGLVVATSYWFPSLESTANCSTDEVTRCHLARVLPHQGDE